MRWFPLLAALCSCAPAPKSQLFDWTQLSKVERQRAINDITRACDLPADRVLILEGNNARVKPEPGDSFESVDCLLGGLKSLRGIQLGFVGNAAYTNEVE